MKFHELESIDVETCKKKLSGAIWLRGPMHLIMV